MQALWISVYCLTASISSTVREWKCLFLPPAKGVVLIPWARGTRAKRGSLSSRCIGQEGSECAQDSDQTAQPQCESVHSRRALAALKMAISQDLWGRKTEEELTQKAGQIDKINKAYISKKDLLIPCGSNCPKDAEKSRIQAIALYPPT